MDDIGCSEHAWSLTWHYPTPAKDTLLKYLIEPLEKYGFMMVMNLTPGFANPEKKLIESSWMFRHSRIFLATGRIMVPPKQVSMKDCGVEVFEMASRTGHGRI